MVMDVYGGDTLKSQHRAPGARRACACHGGDLPERADRTAGQAGHHAEGFLDCLRAISKALQAEMRDKPDEAQRLSTLYAQIGMLAPRLEAVHDTAQLLLQDTPLPEEGTRPPARAPSPTPSGSRWRWMASFIVVKAHASPILPGATLRHHLWEPVRGAVLTSATLTSCGQL